MAETDTIARSFMGTFSALAERYGPYLIASGDLPAFKQSPAPTCGCSAIPTCDRGRARRTWP